MVASRISDVGRQRYAAGGFSGEDWIASSMCGSSCVCCEAWGGEVIVKPPTISMSGMYRSMY